MSSNVYLLFDVSKSTDALPRALEELAIQGYSSWRAPLRATLDAPGEPSVPVRCAFYARNHFRIFVADRAIQFYREAPLPPELARGEQQLVAAVLDMPSFRLRRWLVTEEGWSDDDEPFVNLLREGGDASDLRVELGMAASG